MKFTSLSNKHKFYLVLIIIIISLLVLLFSPKQEPPLPNNTPIITSTNPPVYQDHQKVFIWNTSYSQENISLSEYSVSKSLINQELFQNTLNYFSLNPASLTINKPEQLFLTENSQTLAIEFNPESFMYTNNSLSEGGPTKTTAELIAIANNFLKTVFSSETIDTIILSEAAPNQMMIYNPITSKLSPIQTTQVFFVQQLGGKKLITNSSLSPIQITLENSGIIRAITIMGGFISIQPTKLHKPYTQLELEKYVPEYSREIALFSTTSDETNTLTKKNQQISINKIQTNYLYNQTTKTIQPIFLLGAIDNNKNYRTFYLSINNPPQN